VVRRHPDLDGTFWTGEKDPPLARQGSVHSRVRIGTGGPSYNE
jgi:hypothetical protein